VTASDDSTLAWASSLAFDYSKGWLQDLSTYGTTGAEQGMGPDEVFDISGDLPAAGQGVWYAFRQPGALGGDTGYCNAPGITWGNPVRDDALP